MSIFVFTVLPKGTLRLNASQTFRNTIVVLLTLLIVYGIILSGRMIIVLLVAIIIASAVRPIVEALTARRVPIGLAIASIYLALLTMSILFSVAVIPPIVNQVAQYIENDNRLANRIIYAQRGVERTISDVANDEVSLVDEEQIRTTVKNFVSQFRRLMPTVLDNIGATLADTILIGVMGAYWLTSHTKAKEFIIQLSPPKYRHKSQTIITEIELTLGGYVRSVVTVSILTTLFNLIGMQILGVSNAVMLAFIIGITSIVPMIGSIIGMGLAIVITLIVSPQSVFAVAAVSFIIEQIKSYYIAPRLMSQNVNMDPLLIIVYTSIGFIILGVIGALIAIPIMSTIHILLTHMIIEPYKESLKNFKMDHGLPVLNDEPSIPQIKE